MRSKLRSQEVNKGTSTATRGNNILDLVLARGLSGICAVSRPSSLRSDNDEVIVSFLCSHMPPALATRSTALCYRRADFDGLRNALRATPWDLLDGMNPDEAVSLFYTIVDGAVRDYVPTVTMKKNVFHPGLMVVSGELLNSDRLLLRERKDTRVMSSSKQTLPEKEQSSRDCRVIVMTSIFLVLSATFQQTPSDSGRS